MSNQQRNILVTLSFVAFRWKYWKEFILLQGVLLTSGIVVQVIMLQSANLLHYLFAITGTSLIVFGIKLNHSFKNE